MSLCISRHLRQLAKAVIWSSIALYSASLYALNPERRIDELTHRSWGIKEGAPSLTRALAQTRDGYLWIGSRRGLYRFDGTHFELIESMSGVRLPAREVTSLLAVPDGKLWIGFSNGASLLQEGRITNFGAAEGFPSGKVNGFAHDRSGATWASTADGLVRFEAGRWHPVGSEWGYPGGAAQAILVDHLGTLWVATADRFIVLANGAKTFEPTDEAHTGFIHQMAESADGTVWITEVTRAVRPLEHPGSENHFSGMTRDECTGKYPDSWKVEPACWRPDNLEVRVGSAGILFDRDGGFWITTVGDGLRRIPRPGQLKREPIAEFSTAIESYTTKDGLSADYSVPIFEDREGSIWVGTREGLDQFRNSVLVPVTIGGSTTGFSLAPDHDGYVLVADLHQNIFRVHDATSNQSRLDLFGSSLYTDPRGSLWVSNASDIRRVENDRGIHEAGLPAGKKGFYYGQIKIAADKAGRLWAYVEKEGLFYLENRKWNRFETPPAVAGLTPTTQFSEATGRIWFGFTDGQIIAVDKGSIHAYSAADGLKVGGVEAIFSTGVHVWVGGERGLALLGDEGFKAVPPFDGDSFVDVTGIIEAQDADLWLNEYHGIIHIPAAEVRERLSNATHGVRYQVLNALDGLPGYPPQTQVFPTAIQGTDGRLWFTATRGIVWVDPSSLSKNPTVPPVLIESVAADGKSYEQTKDLQLPAGTAKVQFNYAGLSLAVPERVQYRYKLEGFDRDWQTTGAPGVTSYTNLSAGEYRFRVLAANNDGQWNNTGAALAFRILPLFYQTTWFYVLCALCLAALLGAIYRIRILQVSAQVRGRLEARLTERERIARELHDTLLQSFQGLLLRIQAAANRLPEHEPARAQFEDALERADDALSEGREAVKNIRASSSGEAELVEGLAAMGKQLAEPADGQFRLSIEGTVRELHPIVREEILLIAREALTNAHQHAKADRLEVEVSYGEAELRVIVRDSGQGMDGEMLRTGKPGHWGLLGMRERAKKIRANLTVWSRPGAGTEIDLRVPSRVAYRSQSSGRSFWGRWLRTMGSGSDPEAS